MLPSGLPTYLLCSSCGCRQRGLRCSSIPPGPSMRKEQAVHAKPSEAETRGPQPSSSSTERFRSAVQPGLRSWMHGAVHWLPTSLLSCMGQLGPLMQLHTAQILKITIIMGHLLVQGKACRKQEGSWLTQQSPHVIQVCHSAVSMDGPWLRRSQGFAPKGTSVMPVADMPQEVHHVW